MWRDFERGGSRARFNACRFDFGIAQCWRWYVTKLDMVDLLPLKNCAVLNESPGLLSGCDYEINSAVFYTWQMHLLSCRVSAALTVLSLGNRMNVGALIVLSVEWVETVIADKLEWMRKVKDADVYCVHEECILYAFLSSNNLERQPRFPW